MIGTIWKKKSSVFHKETYKAPIAIVVATEEDGNMLTIRYQDGDGEKVSKGILAKYFIPIVPTTPLPYPKE
jgi:hypothetical protein